MYRIYLPPNAHRLGTGLPTLLLGSLETFDETLLSAQDIVRQSLQDHHTPLP